MSTHLHHFMFALFACSTLASALLVVLLKNILHAAVALFLCLGSIAALYILLGADFVGVSQLLIYAGGILVLLIFGIFLTSGIYQKKESDMPWILKGLIGMLTVGFFGFLAWIIVHVPFASIDAPYVPTTRALGELLLSKYLLPFELISLLLLFALIGAAMVVRKEVKSQ
ncbi:MAG: NADH-quinone oxidoreductase subunit J [Bdellovibrionota bacterium]